MNPLPPGPSESAPSRPRRRRSRWLGWLLVALAALPALRLALFRGGNTPPQDLPSTPIIDLHCHAAGIGAGDSGCFVSAAMRANFRFRIYLRAFGVTEADLLQHGDAYLLDRLATNIAASRRLQAAVVLALDGVVDAQGNLDRARTEVYVPNEFVADAARRHSNLLFGASINPYRHDALARLDDCARRQAVLVKWIPSIMEIDPADPKLVPFYQRLASLGIPLLSHTGPERSFTSARDELADPARLRLPLEHGVRVIAAHTAAGSQNQGEDDFLRLVRMMHEFPHLYADLSALTQINKPGALERALADPLLRSRLVYGSDFPLINTALVSAWYFTLDLPLAKSREIEAIDNPWDRDLLLKQALGVPPDVFARTAQLLRRPAAP